MGIADGTFQVMRERSSFAYAPVGPGGLARRGIALTYNMLTRLAASSIAYLHERGDGTEMAGMMDPELLARGLRMPRRRRLPI